MRFDRSEFIRYCIVGIICTIIDASVFYLLHNLIGYRFAMVCGFCLSLFINYLLNIYWSFQVKPTIHNAIGVIMAHCFNIFVVRMSLMWLFVDLLFISEVIAFIPTLLISVITNFLLIRYIVNK